ncbi:response regulator, partial [Candidatus Dojkabacteria bacterium]|nr:response regulator [Candidatus Dojkabacteria bacterium]
MKKVILIDDDYAIREGIKTLIAAWDKHSELDYEIYSSENGVEGLGYVYLADPDIVIIDTTLPKYSGRELIEYLKTNHKLLENKTKVVVLTENGGGPEVKGLPLNFVVVSKKDPIFEEKLKVALGIKNIELGLLERVVNSLIRIGNKNDILLRKISRSNIFLKLPQYLLWLIYQIEMSIILFTLRLTKGRVKVANIKQEKKDLTQFRVRYYPTLVTVLTSILFILLQGLLFATGGLVVMNTRVESIFAAGTGSTELEFNTTTQTEYGYAEEQLSFTDSGVTLELTQTSEGTPAVEEQTDPETGEVIQEAQEEIPATYEYNIEGEGIITTTNPVEYTELLGFEETSTTVNALGEEVEDTYITTNGTTSVKYQISN